MSRTGSKAAVVPEFINTPQLESITHLFLSEVHSGCDYSSSWIEEAQWLGRWISRPTPAVLLSSGLAMDVISNVMQGRWGRPDNRRRH
jgi:hypothetical protein